MTGGLENPAQKLEVGMEAGAPVGVARGLQGVNDDEFTSALLSCLVSAYSLIASNPSGR